MHFYEHRFVSYSTVTQNKLYYTRAQRPVPPSSSSGVSCPLFITQASCGKSREVNVKQTGDA